MPGAVAEFFNSLPGWVQAVIGLAVGLGAIMVAWKGILPHFVHEVPVGHSGVKCSRNRPVVKNGVPQEVRPGYYLVIPGLIKYLNVDIRQQTSKSEGFRVDLTQPAITYNVDGLSIMWHVVSPFLFVTVNADPELFIIERVREACRNVMSGRTSPLITHDEITAECQLLIPNLEESGMKLITVMFTSASRDTRNVYVMGRDTEAASYVVTAHEL